MYTDNQLKPYIEDLKSLPCDDSIIKYIDKNKNTENFDALVEHCCNFFLDQIQRMFQLKYGKDLEEYMKHQSPSTNFITLYIKTTEYIKSENLSYLIAVAEFYKGNEVKTIEYLKKEFEPKNWPGNDFTIYDFGNTFVGPFKEAFNGFWEKVYDILSAVPTEKGVLELCKAMPLFYNSTDVVKSCKALEEALAIMPHSSFIKELLATNYFNSSMWGNAVAVLEQIDEEPLLLFADNMYFMMAWCYGKLKELSNEISAYEKCIEIFAESPYAINNLGYAYYKAKQYNKALECFRRCLDNNLDTNIAANNYVRTLLAMKRFKDAKDFVKEAHHKINKNLLEKVNNAERTNKRITNDKPLIEHEKEEMEAIAKSVVGTDIKKQQFTSEKILEDELMLRIESGMEVFGKKLKIYRRKGIFGRQYILSNGKRPDLLAEDVEGNLYVIELKKDSGYDDAYEQTVDYLNWFDNNWSGKVKNIYGIICLNNPTQELLDKVHSNHRIKIFEYQISYTER